ncbi:alpha-L-rhamnosidase [Haloferula luteola]|uniref:alpha-L-rhamnosidase n=1 Tax=Haloferula luteola TaxID=595692 RepID=A0A840VE74_9BACT|nr:alpha-L-rhamnosidase [Haloferula luteola]MBB5352129.1 alpha-L-rhamnosidase [Haloferula luteola]
MRSLFLTFASTTWALLAADPAYDLRVSEGFVEPIGFYDATPRFSWKVPASAAEGMQAAYRIVAASSPEKLPNDADLWDSGKVDSSTNAWVAYAGKPLGSRQKVYWQVQLWDGADAVSAWSAPTGFELGLLHPSDWQAQWIRMAPPAAAELPKITIRSARYEPDGHPDQAVDVTDKLRQNLAAGQTSVRSGNELAGGDPLYGVVKQLHLEYARNGETIEVRVPENQAYDLATGAPPAPVPPFVPEYLRKEFGVAGKIAEARLHVTARGLFEVHLNGAKIGNDYLAPGWTPYTEKLESLTYDVTAQIREGTNALGVILGEGWYAGRLGWRDQHASGLHNPELLLQLEITDENGKRTTLVTDDSWMATADGPLRFSGIYDGETYDARKELTGWDQPGYDSAQWRGVTTSPVGDSITIAPKRHQAVRIDRELPAVSVNEPTPGRFVFDFGQNLVGWPKLRLPVKAGETVTIRFAEMLQKDGTLYTDNYRSAKSTDTYTAAIDGTVEWHPRLTFHGFRYVELSGLPEGAHPETSWVKAEVLHSDFSWKGSFESSHALLKQLQSNIQWGLRGNFVDIPTDCPQRDERLGWTGDAQVFAPAAIFNADVHAFFASWLESMRLDQHEDGSIPNVIPNILEDHCGGPGWSDAATVIPWELYVRTGDPTLLEENFDMMRRWVGYYANQAHDGIVDITAYGDWLQPYPLNQDSKADTPKDLLGTAYFARSADFTAKAARVLGKDDEAKRLEQLRDEIAQAFTAKFFDAQGKLTTPVETQTGYLVALGFDLLPEEVRPLAVTHLAKLLEISEGHLRTGFLGTPLLAPVLDRFGRTDLAYAALFKETYPSWFYSIHQGATTMWERWNSYSHEDGFGDAGMNSFNHYAYGAIGQWMYERIAGLAPDPEHPGYQHFFVRPRPGGPLEHASAQLETPQGMARSGWRKTAQGIEIFASVPANCTATLCLPASEGLQVTRYDQRVELGTSGNERTLLLKPGEHRFQVKHLPWVK